MKKIGIQSNESLFIGWSLLAVKTEQLANAVRRQAGIIQNDILASPEDIAGWKADYRRVVADFDRVRGEVEHMYGRTAVYIIKGEVE